MGPGFNIRWSWVWKSSISKCQVSKSLLRNPVALPSGLMLRIWRHTPETPCVVMYGWQLSKSVSTIRVSWGMLNGGKREWPCDICFIGSIEYIFLWLLLRSQFWCGKFPSKASSYPTSFPDTGVDLMDLANVTGRRRNATCAKKVKLCHLPAAPFLIECPSFGTG